MSNQPETPAWQRVINDPKDGAAALEVLGHIREALRDAGVAHGDCLLGVQELIGQRDSKIETAIGYRPPELEDMEAGIFKTG